MPSNYVYLILGYLSGFCNLVFTFRNMILTLSIPERLCKNVPPNIRTIVEAKKIGVQNTSGGFLYFCIINVYGLEFSDVYFMSSWV